MLHGEGISDHPLHEC